MDELTISSWLWGQSYSQVDVKRLAAGFKRHLKQPYRFVLFSEHQYDIEGVECYPIPDLDLTKVKGCFARLRMFDPEFQARHKITGRLVLTDLDTVITGPLDPLFDRTETFVILQGANAVNPCPYTGALQMLKSGAFPEVWSDFSLEAAEKIPKLEFADDQGWLWHKLPDAAGWKAGKNGVYAFQKPGWPGLNAVWDLPKDARLVTFVGRRKPSRYKYLDWVRKNWKE